MTIGSPARAALTVSCIIPAYNEAVRIGAVLDAVQESSQIDEVIVIDDASSDGTAEVVALRTGVRLIRHRQNQGKTVAVQHGVQAASGRLLLLLDADLQGLTRGHIQRLITPVLSGRADISISLRQNAPWPWRLIGLDYISGERVFPRDLLRPALPRLPELPRFGLEVFLNNLLIADNARIAIVRWAGVQSPLKSRKYGFWAGVLADLRMLGDIFHTVSLRVVLGQIIRMRRLRIPSDDS